MIPKILAIAPYEGLRELLLSAKRQRDEFTLDVFLGDLQDGADLAETLEGEGYDLVLSRGGTARAIRKRVALPVLEIELSAVDMLRTIRLAQQSGEKFAIVCFANLFAGIQQLLDYLGLEDVYYPITSEAEARRRISHLNRDATCLIVGDAISVRTASRLAVPALLIQSGMESVHGALDAAMEFLNRTGEVLRQNTAYQRAFRHSHLFLFVFDPGDRLTHSNLGAGQPVVARLARQLPRYLPELRDTGALSLVRRHRGALYGIQGWVDEAGNAIVTVQQRNMLSTAPGALEIHHAANDDAAASHPPLDSIGQMGHTSQSLPAFSSNPRPLALLAEKGTPDEAAVREIHAHSQWSASPLMTLHCGRLSASELAKLLEDDNSPLLENNLCFCVHRLDDLDDDSQQRFLQFASSSSFASRNKLVYVLSPRESLVRRALDHEGALRLALPPLRERMEDLPGLCSLYLSQMGFETGRLVMGLSADAMEQLQHFQFPGNNAQLYRVLLEALLGTHGEQIEADAVASVLSLESTGAQEGALEALLLTGTLEQINRRVVDLVLREEKGNRSRTAERLGISRSTLWRMLGAKDASG